MGSAGTNTSALSIGGYNFDPGTARAQTESWNGTSWTEVNDLNTARYSLAGAGTDNTAAIAFGGISPVADPTDQKAQTESWNGTSWTEVGDLTIATQQLAGAGNESLALAFGGETPAEAVTANTQSWNGTSWSNDSDLNTARNVLAGAGTQPTALAFGGTSSSSATEEWNKPSFTPKTITQS
jgi:hypothetical protein